MDSREGKMESGILLYYGFYEKALQEYSFNLDGLTFNPLDGRAARISFSPKNLVELCFQLIALRCAHRFDSSDSQTE
jgi:hypothetical protein